MNALFENMPVWFVIFGAACGILAVSAVALQAVCIVVWVRGKASEFVIGGAMSLWAVAMIIVIILALVGTIVERSL